jgi:hypothetical protein
VELAGDPVMAVARTVLMNPSVPAAALECLAVNDNLYLRGMVAEHSPLPRSVLERLATDPEAQVRLCVARRNDLDDDIRTLLALADTLAPAGSNR